MHFEQFGHKMIQNFNFCEKVGEKQMIRGTSHRRINKSFFEILVIGSNICLMLTKISSNDKHFGDAEQAYLLFRKNREKLLH
jgi:hypothetical protein